MGFADSKQLTAEERDKLWAAMNDREANSFLGYSLRVLSAEHISAEMLAVGRRSLNDLSFDAAISLVREVITDKGVNVTSIFVDTVGDPAAYRQRLEKLFPMCNVVVESKADATYPVVSAASVAAKVMRDELTTNWQFGEPGLNLDRKFGSGYPGDEETKGWLRRSCDAVFGFPRFARFSWSTAENVLKESAASATWAHDEKDPGQQTLASTLAGGGKARHPRHRAFKARKLEHVIAL